MNTPIDLVLLSSAALLALIRLWLVSAFQRYAAAVRYAATARHRADRPCAVPAVFEVREILQLGTCKLVEINGKRTFVHATT